MLTTEQTKILANTKDWLRELNSKQGRHRAQILPDLITWLLPRAGLVVAMHTASHLLAVFESSLRDGMVSVHAAAAIDALESKHLCAENGEGEDIDEEMPDAVHTADEPPTPPRTRCVCVCV